MADVENTVVASRGSGFPAIISVAVSFCSKPETKLLLNVRYYIISCKITTLVTIERFC